MGLQASSVVKPTIVIGWDNGEEMELELGQLVRGLRNKVDGTRPNRVVMVFGPDGYEVTGKDKLWLGAELLPLFAPSAYYSSVKMLHE